MFSLDEPNGGGNFHVSLEFDRNLPKLEYPAVAQEFTITYH